MKRQTKIMIAALTNLTFLSSVVLAEEGITVVCEADEHSFSTKNTGYVSDLSDRKITYTIFEDRIQVEGGRTVGNWCEFLTGSITRTDIDVECSGETQLLDHPRVIFTKTLSINRRNGEFRLKTEYQFAAPFEFNQYDGWCKKASGF